MLKNDRVTTFTVSELLRKNQQGERGKIRPPLPPSPRLELRILIEKKQSQMKLQRLRKV